MDAFKTMTIISCVMSTITTIAMCTAILPHIKNGMVVVRDAVLWSAFVLIIFAAGWLGLEKIRATATNTAPESVSANSQANDSQVNDSQANDSWLSDPQDRYYRGN